MDTFETEMCVIFCVGNWWLLRKYAHEIRQQYNTGYL